MKEKAIVSAVLAIVLILVFFLPIPKCTYDDGGTREFSALTYKIVKWNRFVSIHNEDGVMVGIDTYTKTSVYLFPNNLKSIDELWEMEHPTNRN